MIDPLSLYKRLTNPSLPRPPLTSTSISPLLPSPPSMLSTLDPLPPSRPPRLLRKPSHSDLLSPWSLPAQLAPCPHQPHRGGKKDRPSATPPLPSYSSFLALDETPRGADTAFALGAHEKRAVGDALAPRPSAFSIDKTRTRKHSFVPPSPRWERLPSIQGVMSIVSTPAASRRPSLVSGQSAESRADGAEEKRRSLRGKKRTLELPMMPPPPPPVPCAPAPSARSVSVMTTSTGSTGSTRSTRSTYITASPGGRGYVSVLEQHPPSYPYLHNSSHNHNHIPSPPLPSLSGRKPSDTDSTKALLAQSTASLSESISSPRTHRDIPDEHALPVDSHGYRANTVEEGESGESVIDFSEWDVISLHASPTRHWSSRSPARYTPSPPRTSSIAPGQQLEGAKRPLTASHHPSSVSVASGSSQGTEMDPTEVLDTFKGQLTSERWDEQLARERQMLVDPVGTPQKATQGGSDQPAGHSHTDRADGEGKHGNDPHVAKNRNQEARLDSQLASPTWTLPKPPLVPPRGASRPPPLVSKDKTRGTDHIAITPGSAHLPSPLPSPKKSISIRRREKRKSGPAEIKTSAVHPGSQETKGGGLIRSPTFNLPIHLRPLPPLPSESNTPPKSSLLNARFHTRLLRPKRPSTAPHPSISGFNPGGVTPVTRPGLPEALLSPRLKLVARDEPPAALGKRASDIADKRKGMTAMSFLALDDPSKTLSNASSLTSLSKRTSGIDPTAAPAPPASSSHGRKVSAKSIDWMVRSNSPAVTHIIPPAELSKIGAENRLKADVAASDLMGDDDDFASRVARHGSTVEVAAFDLAALEVKQRLRSSLNITTTNLEYAALSQSATDRGPSDPLPPTKHRSTGPVVPPRKLSQAKSPRAAASPRSPLEKSTPTKAPPKPLLLHTGIRPSEDPSAGFGVEDQMSVTDDVQARMGAELAIFAATTTARTLPANDRPSTLGRWDSPPSTPSPIKRGFDRAELGFLDAGGIPKQNAPTTPVIPVDIDGEFGAAQRQDEGEGSAEVPALGDGSTDKASSVWSMDVQVGAPSKRGSGTRGEMEAAERVGSREEKALSGEVDEKKASSPARTEGAVAAEAIIDDHPFLKRR